MDNNDIPSEDLETTEPKAGDRFRAQSGTVREEVRELGRVTRDAAQEKLDGARQTAEEVYQSPRSQVGGRRVVTTEPEPEEPAYYVQQDVAGEQLPEEESLLPEGPIYPWRHAVLLKQKRKMRSNEVHYIDHPALGLVIKLTRFDPEQAESGAAP